MVGVLNVNSKRHPLISMQAEDIGRKNFRSNPNLSQVLSGPTVHPYPSLNHGQALS